jgi:hypothetical protein
MDDTAPKVRVGTGAELIDRVGGPRWRLRRLKAMSPGEVGARVVREVRHRADDVQWRAAPALWRRRWTPRAVRAGPFERPLGLMTQERSAFLQEVDPEGASRIVERADLVLAAKTLALGYEVTPAQLQGRDLDRDPASGYAWPPGHGKRLDFRGAPANPKAVWEVNRCQELPVLVAASLVSGDPRYEEAAASALMSWIEQQVPGRGIAWANGFEAGIRVISLALAYDALAGRFASVDGFHETVLGSLWQHARWIERDPSTHSSANNHRVGELVGLLAVARLAPELPEAERWTGHALEGLRREADAQILPDGAGAEQAFAYTLFVLDLLLVAVALLDVTGFDPPSELLGGLERAGCALWAQLGRPEEHDPTYGDADDGRAMRLDGLDARPARGVAAAIAARTGSSYAKTVAQRLDATALWLFGSDGKDRFDRANPERSPRSALLTDAGLVVLRNGGSRVTFDAGSLGYLSIAAHGHADALAVTFSANGSDLIVDPGSGTYDARAPDVRNAFRGTGFHATVLVDDENQSASGGPFLWTRHAHGRLHAFDSANTLSIAEHDGYLGERGVRHIRAVRLLDSGIAVVFDRLEGEQKHSASIRWPLHGSLEADAAGPDEVRASGSGSTGLVLRIAATETGALSVVRGQHDPLEGWSSPRLDALVPSPLVKWDARFQGRLDVVTLIAPAAERHVDVTLKTDDQLARIEIHIRNEETCEAHVIELEVPGVC